MTDKNQRVKTRAQKCVRFLLVRERQADALTRLRSTLNTSSCATHGSSLAGLWIGFLQFLDNLEHAIAPHHRVIDEEFQGRGILQDDGAAD